MAAALTAGRDPSAAPSSSGFVCDRISKVAEVPDGTTYLASVRIERTKDPQDFDNLSDNLTTRRTGLCPQNPSENGKKLGIVN